MDYSNLEPNKIENQSNFSNSNSQNSSSTIVTSSFSTSKNAKKKVVGMILMFLTILLTFSFLLINHKYNPFYWIHTITFGALFGDLGSIIFYGFAMFIIPIKFFDAKVSQLIPKAFKFKWTATLVFVMTIMVIYMLSLTNWKPGNISWINDWNNKFYDIFSQRIDINENSLNELNWTFNFDYAGILPLVSYHWICGASWGVGLEWLPLAIAITLSCISISYLLFGSALGLFYKIKLMAKKESNSFYKQTQNDEVLETSNQQASESPQESLNQLEKEKSEKEGEEIIQTPPKSTSDKSFLNFSSEFEINDEKENKKTNESIQSKKPNSTPSSDDINETRIFYKGKNSNENKVYKKPSALSFFRALKIPMSDDEFKKESNKRKKFYQKHKQNNLGDEEAQVHAAYDEEYQNYLEKKKKFDQYRQEKGLEITQQFKIEPDYDVEKTAENLLNKANLTPYYGSKEDKRKKPIKDEFSFENNVKK